MTFRRNPRTVRATLGTLILAVAAVTAACTAPAPGDGTTTTAPTTTTEAPTTTTEAPTTTTTTSTTLPVLTPAVTFSSATGLGQTGSTVTITGTGFDPSLLTPPGTPANQAVAGIYVALGIGAGPVPTAYTSAKYVRPTGPSPETASGARLEPDGSFSATIATPALFVGQNQAVNCYIDECKVFVWSAHTGTVAAWTFSTPATFAPATSKQVVVSKATNLARAGETVTVTGAGFAATAPGIYVGQVPWTEATAPAGWNLDAAQWGNTKFLPFPSGLSAAGTFRTTIDAAAVIGSSSTDCGGAGNACSIATVKAHGQSDPAGALTSWTPITFAAPAA
jgi:hypothetical protein